MNNLIKLCFLFAFIITFIPNYSSEFGHFPVLNIESGGEKPFPGTYSNQQKEISHIIPVNENYSKYNLSVKLDETDSVIDGTLAVDFFNNDPQSFTRLPFHIYPSGMDYISRKGDIEISNVTYFDGQDEEVLLFEVLSDEQLMWVDLPSSLEPNQRISFRITFQTTLPDSKDRATSYGFDHNNSRIFTCTAFYPIPCVFDEWDGWNTDPYLEIGDPFYFDMAYYDLFVEVPEGMIVAATGELKKSINLDSSIIHHFNTTYPVREIVFSASRYFEVESTTLNGVNVSSFYLSQSKTLWENDALSYAVNAMKLFNESFGSYPYATFNVVEAYGFYGGMEYPCQIQITESYDHYESERGAILFEIVIAHEVGHQWWYQLVGNDEVDWGHLDEGLTCWSDSFYMEYYHPDWHYFAPHWSLDIVRNNDEIAKVNQSIYECLESGTNYYFTAYRKATLILQKLRIMIGTEQFLSGLRHFFQEHEWKIATFPDLQKSFESVLEKDLDWFFFPWFDNPFLPKYSFSKIEYDNNKQSLTVRIEDQNEEINPYSYCQQVDLLIKNDNDQIIYEDKVWINSTSEFTFILSEKPKKVILSFDYDDLTQLPIDVLTLEGNVGDTDLNIGIDKLFIIAPLGLVVVSVLCRKRKDIAKKLK